MAHEKAAHLHENGVARRVSVNIVVLLEMIDVHVDAPPLCAGSTLLRIERREVPSVVTSRERIANALLDELGFQLLARRDVDEDSMEDCLAGLGVGIAVPRVEHGSHRAIGP